MGFKYLQQQKEKPAGSSVSRQMAELGAWIPKFPRARLYCNPSDIPMKEPEAINERKIYKGGDSTCSSDTRPEVWISHFVFWVELTSS